MGAEPALSARMQRDPGPGSGSAASARALPLAGVPLRWPALRADPLGTLGRCLERESEQRRFFPWIAVAYGLGIVLAFAADGPLSTWPPLLAGAGASAAAVAARARPLTRAVFIALGALAFGFAVAVIRTDGVAAPVLGFTIVTRFEGFVESLEQRGAGGRIVVRPVKMSGLDEGARPARIRISARAAEGIRPGDYVTGSARLLPPPEAARPGGYDFARDAWFRGIGAVGSTSGRLAVVDPPPVSRPTGLAADAALDRARNALTSRIADAIGGQAGAVAAALVTGKRGLIAEPTNDVLRAAGIYHVVSISGLHMMLAAGVLFWAARALLALSPRIALTWPVKKIAACTGMAGATAYCIFSGSDVAAERSLCMILVMQGAILFDRPALSMRNLALSGLLVLTREPETLLGPSFQMSFAAVAGLIALAEATRRARGPAEPTDPIGRTIRWLLAALFGVVGTTLVASLATAPFSGFHFGALQPYSLLGNAATLPLVSFVVMPCAVLGTLLYPFGLDRPIWWVMGFGVSGVLKLSEWVAALGGSVVAVPSFGTGALGLLALAILCATIFVSALRWVAILPAALGLASAWAAARPDIYVARDGASAAIRGRDGRLVVVGRSSAFTVEQWLRADGDLRRAADPDVRSGSRCDVIGCTVTLPDGRVVSYLADRRGFAEDCRRAAIVVSRLAAPPDCPARLVVDRNLLASRGAIGVLARRDALEVVSSRTPDDTRPWLRRPPAPASRARAQPAGSARPPPPGPLPAPAEPAAPDPELPAAAEPDGDPGQ
ncbi:MAG: ComEC/Rec2-related protein [Enterovirga sp.]|nr:ComEC/Rec2-related protein [Enterovirga sp.]